MDENKYFIASNINSSINIKEEITKEEAEYLIGITDKLKYYSMAKNYRDIAIDNAVELIRYYDRLSRLNTIEEINREKSNNIGIKINRLLLNYLVSFKLFVDNLQKRYAPHLKNGEDFVLNTINKIYDSEPEYAFLYQLRNFVTHVSIAVDGIKYNENKITLHCHKKHLLDSYSEWKKCNIKFLENLPDSIDLIEMIKKNNILIMSIYISFIGHMGFEIQEIHDNIIKIIKKYKIINPIIYVCKNEKTLENGHALLLGLDILDSATKELANVPGVNITYLSDEDILEN